MKLADKIKPPEKLYLWMKFKGEERFTNADGEEDTVPAKWVVARLAEDVSEFDKYENKLTQLDRIVEVGVTDLKELKKISVS